MRELKSGNIIIRVRASNLALLYYQQEFNGDIVEATSKVFSQYVDIVKSISGEQDINKIDTNNLDLKQIDMSKIKLPGVELLRIIWAMNKAQSKAEGRDTINFEAWCEKYDELKITDVQKEALEEAADGFFR